MPIQEICTVVQNVSTTAKGDSWQGDVGTRHTDDRVGNGTTPKAVRHPGKNANTGERRCHQADLPTVEETHPNVVRQRLSR